MIDLPVLDGRVARASAALQRGGDDPLGSFRDVSGKNAYDALKAYDPGLIGGPHHEALLRWIAFFTDARIGWDLVLEETKREDAEDPALADARAEIVIAKTWNEARSALFTAPNAHELGKALARLDELADPIAAVRRERSARSVEVASRLGLPRDGAVADLARALLDATEPLARDWRKKLEGGATPASVITASLAKEATEGWPAHLGSRWLADAFKTLAPRAPKNVPLPEALGGASFVRAAADWGYALRTASTAKSLPFSLARDPIPTEAFLYGDLLALAVASQPFQRRKLGLPARTAEVQERILARTLFVALRELAALVTVEDPEEGSARVFGQPLPRSLATVWAHGGISGRKRFDVAARFSAALRAWALRDELVRTHDEDWFDNPRAAQWLSNIAAAPLHHDEKADPEVIPRVARAFEEALG